MGWIGGTFRATRAPVQEHKTGRHGSPVGTEADPEGFDSPTPPAAGLPKRSGKNPEKSLAMAGKGARMNNVPPYGAFGDWATPKESTAEHFFVPSFFPSSCLTPAKHAFPPGVLPVPWRSGRRRRLQP